MSERLRIALDVRGLQQAMRNTPGEHGYGGPGRYAHGLLHELLAAGRHDYVLLLDRGAVPDRLAGLAARAAATVRVEGGALARRLRRTRFGMLELLLDAGRVDRALRRAGADVVHFLEHPTPPVRFRPVVVTLHEVAPFVPGSGEDGSSSLRALDRRFQRRSFAVERVVAVSRTAAAEASRRLAVDPARLVIAYPGVDTSVYRPSGNGRARPERRERYVLHAGTLRPRKNPEGLLRAFALVAADEQDLELLCVGPYDAVPSARENVSRLARELGIGHRVRIVPPPPAEEDLARLYRDAEALVFPSLYEGFGLPLAEALACGTPCVAAAAGALPEVGEGLAVFVDPLDPASIAAGMRRALADEVLRARVRDEGPRWATRFSWPALADTVSDVYDEVLA